MDAKEAVRQHEENMQMKEYGRGMAKVMNQRVSSAPKGK